MSYNNAAMCKKYFHASQGLGQMFAAVLSSIKGMSIKKYVEGKTQA